MDQTNHLSSSWQFVVLLTIKYNLSCRKSKGGVGGEARQAAHSKRHKRALKLCLYIFLVYLISFTPIYVIPYVQEDIAEYVAKLYYFNHIGNFLIYCVIDDKFRMEVKSLFIARTQ